MFGNLLCCLLGGAAGLVCCVLKFARGFVSSTPHYRAGAIASLQMHDLIGDSVAHVIADNSAVSRLSTTEPITDDQLHHTQSHLQLRAGLAECATEKALLQHDVGHRELCQTPRV